MDIRVKASTLTRCTSCARYFISGRWIESINEHIKEIVDAEVIAYHLPEGKLPKSVPIDLEIAHGDQTIHTTILLPGINTQCPDCTKRLSHYFEGYLQVRGGSEDAYARARELLETHGGAIKKTTRAPDGYDHMVSSNKAILKTLKDLSTQYVGTSTISATHHTQDHQTSKEKHRVTGLFRFSPHTRKDVVTYEGTLWRIEKIGKQVTLRELSSNKRTTTISIAQASSLEKGPTHTTTIIATQPETIILDESYQPATAHILDDETIPDGSEVIVAHTDAYYIIRRAEE